MYTQHPSASTIGRNAPRPSTSTVATVVSSDRDPSILYDVALDLDTGRALSCTCPHHRKRGAICKHMKRAEDRHLRAAGVFGSRSYRQAQADTTSKLTHANPCEACGGVGGFAVFHKGDVYVEPCEVCGGKVNLTLHDIFADTPRAHAY